MVTESTHINDQKKVLEMLYQHALKEGWEIKKSVLIDPARLRLFIPQLVATIDLKYEGSSQHLEKHFRKEGMYKCPFLNVDYSNFSWSEHIGSHGVEMEEYENDQILVKALLNRKKVYISDSWQETYRLVIWFPFYSEAEAKKELEEILQMVHSSENPSLSTKFLEQGYKLEQRMIRLPFKDTASVNREEKVESKSLEEAEKELYEFAKSTKIIHDKAIENQ